MMKKMTTILLICLILSATCAASALKPRLVVLTDIAPNHIEPDDMESMIRLFAHADLFEIECLIYSTGWSVWGDAGQSGLDLINGKRSLDI